MVWGKCYLDVPFDHQAVLGNQSSLRQRSIATLLPVALCFTHTHTHMPLCCAIQVDAMLALQGVVEGPCIICNGDDVYGPQAFELAVLAVRELPSKANPRAVVIGHRLWDTLPSSGAAVCFVARSSMV